MKNANRFIEIKTTDHIYFIDLTKVTCVFDLIYQLFNELGIDSNFWGSSKEHYFESIENLVIVKERLTNW